MTTERIADHVKFAYWVPNVSGGQVTSTIEQRTDWSYEYNVKLAQTAERTDGATRTGTSPKDFGGLTEQVVDVRSHARAADREVKVGLNGLIIARDTEKEAKDVLREIIAKANRPAVDGFRNAVQQAGASTADKKGMWADSTYQDLVQYNDGFRTQLIGTPEQIAERIAAYRKRGVDLILRGFLHFQEEIECFGERVLVLVREIEATEQDSVDAPVLISA
jgi:FMNH2-dependent dimethyl sulfone monooxygenase